MTRLRESPMTHHVPMALAPHEAILALREDHGRIMYLFALWRAAHDDERRLALLREICSEVQIQARIARELFYPSLAAVLGNNDLVLRRALVDHGSMLGLLKLFEDADVRDPKFAAYMTVIETHVRERIVDEETELLPRLRDIEIDLDALGDQMRQFRSQLLFQAEAVASPGGPVPAIPATKIAWDEVA
jgi:hypothetical protein